MYLVTCSGPDLGFSGSYLSHVSSNSLERHHTAVKTVFRYLAVPLSMSLEYKRSPTLVPLSIVVCSDSDYASYHDTSRFVSAYA